MSHATAALIRRRRLVPTGLSHYVLWGVAIVILFGPIVPVVAASLWSTPLYESGGHLTLANYGDLLSDSAWWAAVRNSAFFGLLNTIGSIVVGVACAILFSRTDLPGRRLFGALLLLPVMLPGIVLVLGWSLMWAPSGFASTWLQMHTPFGVPFDLYSVPGMALVGVSVAAPVVYLLCRGALQGIDPALEDAARTTGASPLRALLSVTLPLLRPAILNSSVLVFALSVEVLGLPLVLGFSKNIDMISTYLYDNWNATGTPRQGLVSAGAVAMLAFVSLLLVLRNRAAGDLGRFTTVGGKPTGAGTVSLGGARWVISAVVALGIVAMVLVPLLGVVLCAFTSVFTPLISPWDVLTTANFSSVLDNSTYVHALTNSLLIATVGGALTTFAIAALSMVAHRSGFRFRGSLQRGMVWPRMMPGLVTGMAFFWSYALLDPSGWLRASLWGMGLAFAVRSVALGYSAFYPVLASIGEDLDNAARTSGATWWQTMRTIVLRLVAPAMAASFVLLFVSMLNDAEPAVFLVTENTPVLGLTMLQLAATSTGGNVAALGVIQMVITLAVLGVGRVLLGVRPRA